MGLFFSSHLCLYFDWSEDKRKKYFYPIDSGKLFLIENEKIFQAWIDIHHNTRKNLLKIIKKENFLVAFK